MDDAWHACLGFAAAVTVGVAVSWLRRPPPRRLPPAHEWEYKAEGKHNVVLTYAGPCDSWRGLAVRLRKAHAGDATESVRERHGLFPLAMDAFAEHVMIPLLGAEYVDRCVTVHVARADMEAFQARLDRSSHLRPVSRRSSSIDRSASTVLLMTDSTTVDAPSRSMAKAVGTAPPGDLVRLGSPIAVEIKPKAGLAVQTKDASQRAPSPSDGAGAPDAATSRAASKFRMQQVWKVSKGKALRASAYCPLDLFVGSPDHKVRALRGLAQTPHNNFRLFARGAQPFPPSDTRDRLSSEARSKMRAREEAAAPGAGAGPAAAFRLPAGLSREAYQLCLDESVRATSIGRLCRGAASSAPAPPAAARPDTWHGLHESIERARTASPASAASAALEGIILACFEREPLLRRLRAAQSLSEGVSSRELWEAYRPSLEAAAGRAFGSASEAYKWARDPSTLDAQARGVAAAVQSAEAARTGQRFLVAQTACDCSVLLSLQLVYARGGGGRGTTQAPGGGEAVDAGALFRSLQEGRWRDADVGRDGGAVKVPQRALGAFRLSDVAPPDGAEHGWSVDAGALEAELRRSDSSPSSPSSEPTPSPDDVWVLYRFSVVDLEPKLWSRIPKYAAKDDEITAAYARLLEGGARTA